MARCLKPSSFHHADVTELHHFADASQITYGAVSYARFVNEDKKVHCSFLVGKSHLAHIKPMTIPRLELSAAVLTVQLERTLKEELGMRIDRSIFWSDSTAVLQCIKNEDRRFHTFVANWLAVIRDGSQPLQWNFVETEKNPADDVSRGLTVEQMLHQDRWLCGPAFLWDEEMSWPASPISLPKISDEDPEVKRHVQAHHMTQVEEVPTLDLMFQCYSSWYKLKKGVAWLLRFKECVQKKCYPQGRIKDDTIDPLPRGALSIGELRSAETHIVRHVQRSSFPSVIAAIQDASSRNSEKCALRSTGSFGSIYKLRPLLDQEGLLRVGGRLENAPLNYESKHQLLLLHNHHVSKLLIMEHHESVDHLGQEYVLASLRQKYWIVKGRAAVRKVLGDCLTCRKQNAPRGQQMMADLPQDRLIPGEPPSSYVGIDLFGPLHVKQGRNTETFKIVVSVPVAKRYLTSATVALYSNS